MWKVLVAWTKAEAAELEMAGTCQTRFVITINRASPSVGCDVRMRLRVRTCAYVRYVLYVCLCAHLHTCTRKRHVAEDRCGKGRSWG